ncbi:MAG: hypothetical protein ABTQ25_02050 [Nitrosomonas ureae]
MNNHTESEQPSTEPAPKRKRRKYKPQKIGASGLSARMAKQGSIRTSWHGLFHDIKGRV